MILLSANGPILLDFTGEENAIIDKYENIAVNTTLEWRPDDNSNYNLSAGVSSGSGLFFQDLGIGYAEGTALWGQANATMETGLLKVSVDYNDGGGRR